MDAAKRTPKIAPRNLRPLFITPAAAACLDSLDDLVHAHRETTIEYDSYQGSKSELLGNVTWGFPSPELKQPAAPQIPKLPLAEIWQAWQAGRTKKLRDKDGLELVRALLWSRYRDTWQGEEWKRWAKQPKNANLVATFSGRAEPTPLRYSRVVVQVVEWLLFLDPPDAREYLLDAVETAFSLVPSDEMAALANPVAPRRNHYYFDPSIDETPDWRDLPPFMMWSEALQNHQFLPGRKLTPAQMVRRWRIMHWCDEPFPGARRRRVDRELLLFAYDQRAANIADIADHLLGPRAAGNYSPEPFDLLTELTSRQSAAEKEPWLAAHPEVKDLLDRAIERILQLELNRGDEPTAAVGPAHALGALWGIETLRRILQSLGKADFKLSASWRRDQKEDRRNTLTTLARLTYPRAAETSEEFLRVMKSCRRRKTISRRAAVAAHLSRATVGQASRRILWLAAHERGSVLVHGSHGLRLWHSRQSRIRRCG